MKTTPTSAHFSYFLASGLVGRFLLLAAFCIFALTATAQTYTVGKNNVSSNATIEMKTGVTLVIPEGQTFSGSVNWNGTGGTIENRGTFNCNLNVNTNGVIFNYGKMTSSINFNGSGVKLHNYKEFNSNSLQSSTNSGINNYAGGVFSVSGELNLNSAGGTFYNQGTVVVTGNTKVDNAYYVSNYAGAIFTVRSTTYNNSGQIDNAGTWTTDGFYNNSTTRNCGTWNVTRDFTSNGGSNLANWGYFNIGGSLTNNGAITGPTNGGTGIVVVKGAAYQNGGATFARTGKLDICINGKGSWSTQGGTIGTPTTTSGATYCQATSATRTGGCTYSNATPLPVELTSFTAKLSLNRVALNWTTASEKNNDKFVVERSADGKAFTGITEVAGHGTSTTASKYSAIDTAPLAGTSYYRLKQVDQDGTTSYSPVVSVTNAEPSKAMALNLYPNPATNQVVLDLSTYTSGSYAVQVLNLSGQQVLATRLNGGSAQTLDIQSLPAGSYLLRVQGATEQVVQRLVKQ